MKTWSAPAALTGAARAAKSTNDGYTLITGHMGTHAAAVPLYPKLAYHPESDFEPVALLAGTPILILARKGFPRQQPERVRGLAGSANTDKLNMAHAGVGSVSYSSCELLNSVLDIRPTGVPFNGTRSGDECAGGPAQVDYMCDQIVNAVPQIKGGTIPRSLRWRRRSAIRRCRTCRRPSRPGCPPIRPRPGTRSSRRRARRSRSWRSSTRRRRKPSTTENVRKRLLELGSDIPKPEGRTREALAALVKSEIAKWSGVLKAATN